MMAKKKRRSKKLRKEDLKILKMLESPATEKPAVEKSPEPVKRDTVQRLIHLLETDDREAA